MSGMSSTPPAGWYPAPSDPGLQEWWDGGRWTGLRSPAPARRPGWFADPSGSGWRWWDGTHWTIHRVDRLDRPRLPIWFSIPLLIVLPVFLYDLYPVLAEQLEVLLLAGIPVLLMLLAFLWLNRALPQPRESRWHAFAWGAVVAGTIAGVINDGVAVEFGETAARVIAAPVGEELLKGLGILMAIRRGEVANRLHGAIIAFWVAAGFTLAEEIVYLSWAVIEGDVAETFLYRGILGSFAHPLFTVWIGLMVGAAVEAGLRPARAFLLGLVPAVGLHAIWNGTQLPFGIFLAFILILVVTVAHLVRQRRAFEQEHAAISSAIVRAAATARLPAHRLDALQPFLTTGSARAARQSLPRAARPQFDTTHAAIARAFTDVGRRRSVTRRELEAMADYAEAATGAIVRRV